MAFWGVGLLCISVLLGEAGDQVLASRPPVDGPPTVLATPLPQHLCVCVVTRAGQRCQCEPGTAPRAPRTLRLRTP